MLASELYALSHGKLCKGPTECHWCGAACERLWPHDDPPPVPFIRSHSTAKRPGNAYICVGCWTWRRRRVTVPFLTNCEYVDLAAAPDYAWWVTEEGAFALRAADYATIAKLLVRPPLRFCLALLDGDGAVNHLQLMLANDVREIKGDTPLEFTVNGVPHTYSVYELEEALKGTDTTGMTAGTRFLAARLAPHVPAPTKDDPDRGRGRPPAMPDAKTTTKKIVRR